MPLQMALDELLFEFQKKEARAPTLRFFISSSPWISVGCSFRDSAALSKSDLVLKNSRVPVCRRITGGGCVLHGEDLIFSLIVRYDRGQALFSERGQASFSSGKKPVSEESACPLISSTRTSYAKIHESVKRGLQSCGFDPKFYSSDDELSKGSDCFDFPVESDLSWKEKKIAGGAQKRSEGVLLHHESISIPPGVGRENLIQAIRKGLESVFGVSIQHADLDPGLFFEAERLVKVRIN